MKLRLSIFLLGLIWTGLLIVGCDQDQHVQQGSTENKGLQQELEEGDTTDYSSITITDSSGRTVTIDQPVERVAFLDNGTAEILQALGVSDRLVGNHKSIADSPLYPELQDVPVVATHSEINYEKLAEVKPQVVFSSVRAHGVVEEQEHLQNFDITDIKLNLRNPNLIKDEVMLLGKVFDEEEKARELVEFYDKYEQFIASRIDQVNPEDRPTIFVEYHAGDFYTGAPDSRFYQQTVLAGADNIASSLSGEPQVDAEWVAENDPDVFLRESSDLGYGVESYEDAKLVYQEIIERPALANTTALKNNRVYLIAVDIYSRPAYIVGVSYLSKWMYPDHFEDFDPEQVHKEYMELFHPGMPYKGLWTYTGVEGE